MENESGEQTGIDDPLFADAHTKRSLIVRPELLEVGHVPDQNRIIGRDVEMGEVASKLEAVIRNEPPSNFIIYGKTGTGKSLVSQSVAVRAQQAATQNGADVGVVAISNKINYRKSLNERVKSSLGDDELVFSPYDGTQLQAILEARTDAFRDGALDSAVIPKTAALAAREHGDARRAIRILRNAGDIATKEEAEKVREDHVDRAQKRAEADRLCELLSGLPPHSKYILFALANLDTKDDSREEFRTTEVYETYEAICESEVSDPLGLDRVRDLLRELSFLEITESNKTGGGRGRGSYTLHTLMNSPEAVFEMINK
ncbi:Orc1-type DNA replication protein [Natronomonas moolapensis 8.8.11]|uniref:Orc1-type DNA replication protein n=1 Tax=Natronomonas moolapensis (strain DSM 18674 / CECT 7526 / JCM 14361 / 8.8.11) TaxID=268739 RepID=M1XKX5_NATM8|nr:AAA family ATPase [Natronomonas moolapensis]CCQ36682.1 Orc1-type DNA replication protein [Natronomonas moolapensis 8.8.11]